MEQDQQDAPRPIELSPVGMALDEALEPPTIQSRMPAPAPEDEEELLPGRRRRA